MEDKQKKRGRQPKVVKEPVVVVRIEQEPDQMPVVEPLKAKGGKRKVTVSETVATEKPQRKAMGRKTKASASEQSNGLEANEAVKSDEPVKKSRSTRKNVAVDQPNGVSEEHKTKAASSEESNGLLEKAPVVEKNRPVKKSRSTKKETVVERPEPVIAPVKEQKTKGKKIVANDTKQSDEPEKAVESPMPAKRGRAKTSAAKVAKEPEDTAIPPKPKGRGKGKDKNDTETAVKKKEEDSKSLSAVEATTATTTKPNARGKKKVAAVEDASPAVAPTPESPAKTVELPKRGRTRKAIVVSDADGEADGSSNTNRKASGGATNGDIPTVTQRKRTKALVDDAEEVAVPSKEKKAKVATPKMNKCATDYGTINFALGEPKPWTLKISSWNVAGLRGWVGKGGLDYIEHEQPDILCVQETKCTEDQLPDEARHIKGYHPYWLCKPGGYAGVAIYSKKMPIHVVYGLGDEEQDQDGRLLTAEYEKFYLVCVYVPNAGKKLVTLPKRLRWNEKFHQYLRDLDAKKPVILCGDMNVAHEEIDLANPKTNRKNAGFTQEERDGMSNLLSLGFVDTFRKLYPDRKGAYTFWTYMGGARAKNVGWRLDYFITSERLVDKVTDNVIRTQVYGSDHCPVTLFLNI